MRPPSFALCLALSLALTAVAAVASPTLQDSAAPSPGEAAPAEAAPAAGTPAEAPAAAPEGNAETGRLLAYTCQGCHGVTGYKNAYPSFHVPRIGGQSAPYLVQALTEYKEGKRKHPTMQAQSQSFSAQDIADLAAYLSTLKQGQP
ncbi:MAG: cytochrome c [Pseudoxanthomonas sp.]